MTQATGQKVGGMAGITKTRLRGYMDDVCGYTVVLNHMQNGHC